MTTEWRVTHKPDFFKALLVLPPKETHQVLEKIDLLAQHVEVRSPQHRCIITQELEWRSQAS
jgi:hypothetical protein